ncbi:hypothetical protein QJS04_geneDACA012427 [Acorus gramineus]|uniref:Uncharacterized protein n=1 Tax=Acorus gramineus TaxID=55184 RepID=A0AAV9B9Y3_ACOGR|nr:hypothetical protein QJS04_geneDACA012427 [Acorus gramineus]
MVQRLICTPKVNESSQCNIRNIAIVPMKDEKSPKALKVEGHSFLSIKDFVKESMDEEHRSPMQSLKQRKLTSDTLKHSKRRI